VTVFAEMADIEATLRQVELLGGKTIMPAQTFPDKRPSAQDKGTVTFAYFVDPEGHLIGLCQRIVRP
jgi:predicted enzyme related to lactoylglutathione lyase